jgi:tetratricopeptide (TPR) repeat protein
MRITYSLESIRLEVLALIRPALRYVLVATLTAALAAAAVVYVQKRMAAEDVGAPPFVTTWEYKTEQEWIVAEVVKALIDMAHYAQTRSAPDTAAFQVRVKPEVDAAGVTTFQVTLPARGKTWALRATDHIWAPEMYAPLAADLLGPQVVAAAKPSTVGESVTLAALTRPRTDVMVAESERVSAELALDMTNAGAHQDAALLFATLALREYSGNFYDNHRSLCRLTSHLAMAQGVGKGSPSGLAGRFAEITLRTLAFTPQRGTLARLDAIDAMPNPSAAVKAWSRALRMRNTEDWRLLPDPQAATLLERLEYLTWIAWKTGLTAGLEFLDKTEQDDVPDWGSRMLSGSLSVEAGNRFIPMGMAQVFQDVNAMPLGLAGATDPKQLVEALNQEPSAGPVRLDGARVVVEVLDRGTWAAWAQRHALHHIEKNVWFTDDMLGMPDQAKAMKAQFAKVFGGLRQYPLAARRMAKDTASYEAAMRPSMALLSAHPEWIGGHNWNLLLERPVFPAATFAVPSIEFWCTPLYPAGTYFEWPKRLYMPGGHLRVRGPALQKMREALPNYSNVVRAAVFDRLGEKATVADLKSAYGPLLDYDINVMTAVARASYDDPPEHKKIMRRIGDLNPDRLGGLGYYLVEQGELDEAARVYEEYRVRARDRVGVSNQMRWLVYRLFDQGNKQHALEVAREAAEVYSAAGLSTLANLYERMGRWADAEEWFRRMADRYEDNESTLLSFYLRRERAGKEGRASGPREALLVKIFPAGMEKMTEVPGEGSVAPTGGLQLVGASRDAKAAGLAGGDIIVAVDGVRVQTHDQYLTVRLLRREPEMALTVWRKDHYVATTSRHFDRWLSTEVKEFKGPPQKERQYI